MRESEREGMRECVGEREENKKERERARARERETRSEKETKTHTGYVRMCQCVRDCE